MADFDPNVEHNPSMIIGAGLALVVAGFLTVLGIIWMSENESKSPGDSAAQMK